MVGCVSASPTLEYVLHRGTDCTKVVRINSKHVTRNKSLHMCPPKKKRPNRSQYIHMQIQKRQRREKKYCRDLTNPPNVQQKKGRERRSNRDEGKTRTTKHQQYNAQVMLRSPDTRMN